MKLLQEIIHPDFPTIGKQLDKRSAARIILIDNDWKVPLLYSSKYDIYVIPGGWIEQWENIQEAVIREAKEETGITDITFIENFEEWI